MAMVAVIIITGGVITVIMAVVAAAVVMAPGKGSKKNPEKSSPRREKGIPSGLPMQKGAQMGIISAPLDASPAQEKQQNIKQGAAYPLPEDGDRARIGRKAGPKKKDRRGVL